MKYENSYAEFREDIGCRERSTAARILLRESCKHRDEAQQPHFPVLCPSHPTLGAFAASLTCTSFWESSISQHTWLNTSPCYLLPIKQHIFCMYLWQTEIFATNCRAQHVSGHSIYCNDLDVGLQLRAPVLQVRYLLQICPTLLCFACLGTCDNTEDVQRLFSSLLGECLLLVLLELRSTAALLGCKVSSETEGWGKEWQVLFTEILSPNGFGRAQLCWSYSKVYHLCRLLPEGGEDLWSSDWWKGLPPLPLAHILRVGTERCSTALSQEITRQIKQLRVLVPSSYLDA